MVRTVVAHVDSTLDIALMGLDGTSDHLAERQAVEIGQREAAGDAADFVERGIEGGADPSASSLASLGRRQDALQPERGEGEVLGRPVVQVGTDLAEGALGLGGGSRCGADRPQAQLDVLLGYLTAVPASSRRRACWPAMVWPPARTMPKSARPQTPKTAATISQLCRRAAVRSLARVVSTA